MTNSANTPREGGRCILVTGPGHAGTRLLVRMLDQHPDVSVPMRALNGVMEYTPFHQFFIQSMDRTALHAPDYAINEDELRFLVDAYMENIDREMPFFVLKLPYYPLNCLDFFVRYFEQRVILVFSERPAEKIVKSFQNKGEDRLFFQTRPEEILRQVKKLDLENRKRILASGDSEQFFHLIVEHCNTLRDGWTRRHPDLPFHTVDIEAAATDADYLRGKLTELGLSGEPAGQMQSVVDAERLLHHAPSGRPKPSIVKRLARKLLLDD